MPILLGYYLLVEPLDIGPHTICFAGTVPGDPDDFTVDVTYQLTVLDPSSWAAGLDEVTDLLHRLERITWAYCIAMRDDRSPGVMATEFEESRGLG